MRMTELMNESEKPGIYVGAKFTSDTTKLLLDFCKDNKIPDHLKKSEFHTTVVYSKDHFEDFEATGDIDEPWTATVTGFDVWESKPNSFDNNHTYCLVMKLKCKELADRHNEATHAGASYDFDEYIPHVTLSYDVGKTFDVSALKWNKDHTISISNEYKCDLN